MAALDFDKMSYPDFKAWIETARQDDEKLDELLTNAAWARGHATDTEDMLRAWIVGKYDKSGKEKQERIGLLLGVLGGVWDDTQDEDDDAG